MGLKAALHSINATQSSSVPTPTMSCFNARDRIQKRFNQANADFIFGGETQLWPEIHAYFGRTDEIAWKEKCPILQVKSGRLTTGEAHRRTPERLGQRRLFHGEENVMLKYIEETEQRMADTRARSRRVGDDLSPGV